MPTLVRKPAAVLAPFVEARWYVEEPVPPGLERRLPTGHLQLVVNLDEDALRWYDGAAPGMVHGVGGAGLCGAVAEPVLIDTAQQRATVGVLFRPGGTLPFFTAPAGALTEPLIGLDALWGRDGATLRERVLEQPTPAAALETVERVLLRRVVRPLEEDHAVAAAVSGLGRGVPVGTVADRLGASRETFGRRFRHAVGLGPKAYARVRRLQRVLAAARTARAAGGPDWARLAAEQGFVDQAHLIHDFRALTGLTPTGYRPRSAGQPNHVPAAGDISTIRAAAGRGTIQP